MSPGPPRYPDRLEVVPLARPPEASVRVPGSKSITNRALVLAALNYDIPADPDDATAVRLSGVLQSEDTEVMVASLRRLRFGIDVNWSESLIDVLRHSRLPTEADLYVANSGTTMRFLAALVSLGHGRYRLDGVARMRERPIQDLLDSLRQVGVRAVSEQGNGCPPVAIESKGWKGSRVRVRGDVSSQFLSGLLMTAVAAPRPMEIEVEGPLVSAPYVMMTVEMMRRWGWEVEVGADWRFRVGGRTRVIHEYEVEPDASAASYFWAAAAITGGTVQVKELTTDSLQGDVRFVEILEEMGCSVSRSDLGLAVTGGPLRGIDVDMNDVSDTVMTLGAVACFAEGPTTIRNVAHVRHKETDRLAALATELRRVGAEVQERSDGLTITPRPLHGAEIATYDDHRMAMSLALVGLRVPGVVIKNPGCVAKTYPDFFADLDRLRR